MVIVCQNVINMIEEFAPPKMAAEWDKIGLQVGNPGQPVSKVFLSLDLNGEVLDEALTAGADMLVVHHTPFFKPLAQVRTDTPAGLLLSRIIKNDLILYTAHTNLDAAPQGVNTVLARLLNLREVQVLQPDWQEKLCKLVVFVPLGYTERVREALARCGAGWIGNYSDCTFQVQGTGTFRPLEGTNPFVGTVGELERAVENRLETIFPIEKREMILKALFEAHPYEEVAYDLYPLLNEGKHSGLGCVGTLSQPLTLAAFLELVKEKLQVPYLRYCGEPGKTIHKVALCGGSGGTLLSRAAASGAQVYLTGDVKHHEAQEALALGMAIADAGHYGTENPIIAMLADALTHKLANSGVKVMVSRVITDPFRLFTGSVSY